MAKFSSITLPPKEKTDKEELCKALIRVFEYLDKGEKGVVAVEDLVAYVEDAAIELGDDHIERLLSVADDEGQIVLTVLQNLATNSPLYSAFKFRASDLTKEVKKVEAVWGAMDKNKDGMVTKGEYGMALNSLNRRQVDFIFARYDKDGDKNLSQEEFAKMMESWKKPKKRKRRRRKETN